MEKIVLFMCFTLITLFISDFWGKYLRLIDGVSAKTDILSD